MIYGYARVSTTDQDLAIQHAALTAHGCDVVKSEKVSGDTRDGRVELEKLLEFLRRDDTLVVTRIDRLARSLRDLQNIVHELGERGVALTATEQPIDTSSAAGKAFLAMLGVFAEFETTLRRERQAEGIAKAKAAGVYKGRKPSVDRARVRRLVSDGVGATAIARKMGIGRASVYRVTKGLFVAVLLLATPIDQASSAPAVDLAGDLTGGRQNWPSSMIDKLLNWKPSVPLGNAMTPRIERVRRAPRMTP